MSIPQAEGSQYASGTQKFLYEKFSKVILSKNGIIVIIAIWIIYSFISIIGITNLKVDFKTTYFISPDATIRSYLDR
jgi:hypothetical protein